jgi:hypothetical protein
MHWVSELYSKVITSNYRVAIYYFGSAEGHEYPDLQVGDEVNPRRFFLF